MIKYLVKIAGQNESGNSGDFEFNCYFYICFSQSVFARTEIFQKEWNDIPVNIF